MLIFKLEKFRLVRNTLVIERHLTTTIWTRATESLFWMLPFSAVIQYISAQDFSFSCQYAGQPQPQCKSRQKCCMDMCHLEVLDLGT